MQGIKCQASPQPSPRPRSARTRLHRPLRAGAYLGHRPVQSRAPRPLIDGPPAALPLVAPDRCPLAAVQLAALSLQPLHLLSLSLLSLLPALLGLLCLLSGAGQGAPQLGCLSPEQLPA